MGLSDVVPAFTRIATVVVVSFAITNAATVRVQLERSIAFRASVVRQFDLTTEEQIVSTLAEHQRILLVA